MNAVTYLTEKIQETIISDYLKRHPQISREEVITHVFHGRVFIGIVEVSFRDVSKEEKELPPFTEQQKKQLDELTDGGETRYTSSLTSIQNSKKYVDWLFYSRLTGFSEKDREESCKFLERHESICKEQAEVIESVKTKFMESMEGKMKMTQPNAQKLVYEYMKAARTQLQSQHAVFKREVDLGDRFVVTTKKFVEESYSAIHAVPKPSVARALTKSMEILRNQQIDVDVNEIKTDSNLQSFNQALSQLEDRLEKRRTDLQKLQHLLTYLETLIEEYKPVQPIESQPSNRIIVTTQKYF